MNNTKRNTLKWRLARLGYWITYNATTFTVICFAILWAASLAWHLITYYAQTK